MHVLFFVALGLVAGTMSGLLGIGGGIVLIPVLTELFDLDHRKAAGMTLAVLAVPVTLPGVWQYYAQGHLDRRDLALAGCIAGTFAVGAFLGANLQNVVSVSLLRTVFGLLMIYLAVQLLANSDAKAANALAGLVAMALAWLAYLGLRSLGRAHLPPPPLGEHIRRQAQKERPPIDYSI